MKLIDISSPKYPNTFAMVDDEDFDAINAFKWCVLESGTRTYAERWRRKSDPKGARHVLMHRVIMNPAAGLYVDHINGNGLDNTKANLRVCTNAENGRNSAKTKRRTSSGFKGVHFQKAAQKFQAYIGANRRRVHLGYFDNEIDAAVAYNKAAAEHFGEFSRLNNIPRKDTP